MSDQADKSEKGVIAADQIVTVRISITSPNLKALQKVTNDLVARAQENKLNLKGPTPYPTRVLKITTRKTPNGEGSKTWDSYEMRIHKRLVDIESPYETVRRITAYNMVPGVRLTVVLG